MKIYWVKIFGKISSWNYIIGSFILFKAFAHSVYLWFKIFSLPIFLSIIIVNMKISFLLIRWIKLFFYSNSTYFVTSYAELSAFFKGSFYLSNQFLYKIFHPLHHNDEVIPTLIHVVDIFFTEISSVQDKAYISIAISFCFFKHKLKLWNIYDTSRIIFIIKRNCIVSVIGYRVIDYRCSRILFCMPKLNQIYVTGMAVLIGWIIRYIYCLPMVSLIVPYILKLYTLILRNSVNKSWHFGITIYPHVISEQRVIISIVRIVLPRIILSHYGVCCYIKKKPTVLSDNRIKYIFQTILGYYLS